MASRPAAAKSVVLNFMLGGGDVVTLVPWSIASGGLEERR